MALLVRLFSSKPWKVFEKNGLSVQALLGRTYYLHAICEKQLHSQSLGHNRMMSTRRYPASQITSSMFSNWMRSMRYGLHRLIIDAAHDRLPPSIASVPVYMTLDLISFLYGIGRWCIHACYKLGILKSHKLPVPVISVGNVIWGGTGKTPMVMLLAENIKARGGMALILTRGYGADEDIMLTQRLQGIALVASGSNRYEQGLKALTSLQGSKVSHVILDDGLQHNKIKRDRHVVMINCLEPWGNGKLLPRGTLRQPLHEGLQLADVVALHHSDLVDKNRLAAIQSQVVSLVRASTKVIHTRFETSFLTRVRPSQPPNSHKPSSSCSPTSLGNPSTPLPLHERTRVHTLAQCNEVFDGDAQCVLGMVHDGAMRHVGVYALAGVACPQAFFAALRDMPFARVLKESAFPDHHMFTDQELEHIATEAAHMASLHTGGRFILVTTEKDAFRCGARIADAMYARGCEGVYALCGHLIVHNEEDKPSIRHEQAVDSRNSNGSCLVEDLQDLLFK